VANQLKKCFNESQKANGLSEENKVLQKELQELQRPLSKKPSTACNAVSLESENLKLMMENSRLGNINQTLIGRIKELVE
jgi:hypothetical protein